MWPKSYRDYQLDRPLIKFQVEPSHGIIGCEMHDLNGWGNSLHIPHGRFQREVTNQIKVADNLNQ